MWLSSLGPPPPPPSPPISPPPPPCSPDRLLEQIARKMLPDLTPHHGWDEPSRKQKRKERRRMKREREESRVQDRVRAVVSEHS